MSVEITSAASVSGGAWAVPDNIYARAELLLEHCVRGTAGSITGLGGSATLNFQRLISWAVINPVDPLASALPPVPASASFFTVTISGPTDKLYSPGDYSPIIPQALRDANEKAYDAEAEQRSIDPEVMAYLDRVNFWQGQAEGMSSMGNTRISWWRSQPRNSNQMMYQCDAGLGTPSLYDCIQVQSSQINYLGDSLAVGPGIVHFLHSNTCFVAVSATVDLVLTWSQVRIAIATLVGTCINTPYHTTSLGGKAYHRAIPSSPQSNSHKARKKRKSVDELTGLNALPPAANVTIFEQLEPWTNTSDEMRSCTWLAVSSEHSVRSCASWV